MESTSFFEWIYSTVKRGDRIRKEREPSGFLMSAQQQSHHYATTRSLTALEEGIVALLSKKCKMKYREVKWHD